MPYQFKPVGYRVLVEKLPDLRQLAGDIQLPASATDTGHQRWKIIDIGDALTLSNGTQLPIPPSLKPGVEIQFVIKQNGSGAVPVGNPALFGGRELVTVPVQDITGIYSGEPPAPIVTATPAQVKKIKDPRVD